MLGFRRHGAKLAEAPKYGVLAPESQLYLTTCKANVTTHSDATCERGKQMASDRPPRTPAGHMTANHVVAENVWRLRRRQGWTQADLRRELAKAGWKMSGPTVVALETGKRSITVAEL